MSEKKPTGDTVETVCAIGLAVCQVGVLIFGTVLATRGK